MINYKEQSIKPLEPAATNATLSGMTCNCEFMQSYANDAMIFKNIQGAKQSSFPQQKSFCYALNRSLQTGTVWKTGQFVA